MTDEARSYFRERAETQLRAGQSAHHPEAAKAHYLLAGLYFDRAYNAQAEQGALPRARARAAQERA